MIKSQTLACLRKTCTFSPEVRQIWSNIPNGMKVVILRTGTVNSNDGVNNHSKNYYETVKSHFYPPRKFTKDHFHELLTELISESSLSEKNEVDAPEDDPDSDSTLLVNSTSANSINTGNTRKLMSMPDKGLTRSKQILVTKLL